MSASRAEKGPSAFGVMVAAVFMFVAGGVLGFFYLASFEPVQFANSHDHAKAVEAKKDAAPIPGEVYYYRSLSSAGSRTWQAKRQSLLEGRNTSVIMSFGELNAWWAAEFGGLRFDESADSAKVKVIPGAPAFAVGLDDKLHIAMPLDGEAFGREFEVMCIIRGVFDNSGEGARFDVQELFVNNARLPWGGRIADSFLEKLGETAFGGDDFKPYREAWARLDRIELGEAGIRFVLR